MIAPKVDQPLNHADRIDFLVNNTEVVQPPIAKKKPLIPSLKVGGLGLSSIVKEDGKTQEELDVENLVKDNKAAAAAAQ